MKLLEQCALLFAVCLGSIAIAESLPFNFPVSIISMAILFILLCTKIIKEHQIADLSVHYFAYFFCHCFDSAGSSEIDKEGKLV